MKLWFRILPDQAPPRPPARARVIIEEVAAAYNIGPLDITGQSRRRRVAWPRQEAMWRLRKETTASLPQIGLWIGGRDHTTVLHGIRAHEARQHA